MTKKEEKSNRFKGILKDFFKSQPILATEEVVEDVCEYISKVYALSDVTRELFFKLKDPYIEESTKAYIREGSSNIRLKAIASREIVTSIYTTEHNIDIPQNLLLMAVLFYKNEGLKEGILKSMETGIPVSSQVARNLTRKANFSYHEKLWFAMLSRGSISMIGSYSCSTATLYRLNGGVHLAGAPDLTLKRSLFPVLNTRFKEYVKKYIELRQGIKITRIQKVK